MLTPAERELVIVMLAVLVGATVVLAYHNSENLFPLRHLPRKKLKHVKTGDLLLFRRPGVFCDLQRLALGTPYTHVGIAFVDRAGQHWVWETNTNRRGNQLNSLFHKLSKPGAVVVVRPLLGPPVDVHRFEAVMRQLKGTPYSYDIVPMLLSSWLQEWILLPFNAQSNRGVSGDRPHICSTLVLDTYERLGVLTPERKPSLFTGLKEFSERYHDLNTSRDYSFNGESRIEL